MATRLLRTQQTHYSISMHTLTLFDVQTVQ